MIDIRLKELKVAKSLPLIDIDFDVSKSIGVLQEANQTYLVLPFKVQKDTILYDKNGKYFPSLLEVNDS